MRRVFYALIAGLLAIISVQLTAPAASATDQPAGRLVQDVPADFTPNVLDGRVLSIVQVGDTIILGGRFNETENAGSQTQIPRSNLVAFNAQTGKISTNFHPNPNGTVNVVLPAGDGQTVYVGGSFRTIDGQSERHLARIRVSDGSVVSSFDGGSPSGVVNDLRLSDGRLWVAGTFQRIAGHDQAALATLNASTGQFDPYMGLEIAGTHNGGYTNVKKIDIDPSGHHLIAEGNFTSLSGVTNDQFFMLDVSGASAQPSDFHTDFYSSSCSNSFDTYMRDLDFSPDGSFFVVSTTGAYHGDESACDETARWETSATGQDLKPSWVDYTGGDTTYAVEITDTAVYVGGHQRWQNNPFAGDSPGPGAVSRPGIAALDPANGLPFSWNPTRARGVGVFDFLATDQGLWVGSDTDRIGNWAYHGRIALMPAGGKEVAALRTPQVPNDIYAAGSLANTPDPSVLYRVNAAGPEIPVSVGPPWTSDTADSPTPYNNGSGSRASWSGVGSLDNTVPAGTPRALFDTELWDPDSAPEMQWSFPVPQGVPVQVRLYFSSHCSCTDDPGERVFDVAIDNKTVLHNFDIVAAVGQDVGTMRKFDITSDGSVDIDFSHLVENPLINAIEIVRTDRDPVTSPSGSLVKRSYDSGTVGPTEPVPGGGLQWESVRGATMINGSIYTAWADGSFNKRTFDGNSYGASEPVNTQDAIVPLTAWHTDAASATGMFFDFGRLYFTLEGSDDLYYRYFTPESGVVGSKRFIASGNVSGIDFSKVRGMFVAGTKLFWATPDGDLHRIDWKHGAVNGAPVPGSQTVVSGPGIDGVNWASRSLFLYQDSNGVGAPAPPTAAFTSDCTSVQCTFDASGSSAPGSSISDYQWNFGDGATGSGKTPSHDFVSTGTYNVTLTVSTADGGTDSVSHQVSVTYENQPPSAAFTQSCDGLTCDFDASGSSDPEGPLASYAWDFGDGASVQGKSVSHTFDSAGTYQVKLTVTDSDGATDSVTHQVTPSQSAVDYVASESTNGNRRDHTVRIPAAVKAGDTLLLFMTNNTDSVTVDGPAGWTLLKAIDQGNFRSHVWTKTAESQDLGSVIHVQTSGYTKSSLTVAAYRSSSGDSSVSASAQKYIDGPASSLTTPTVNVEKPGSWLVSYWGVKSAGTPTAPSGLQVRSDSEGSGGGQISSTLADSGAAVATGDRGGLTATVADSASHAATYSVVIALAGGGPNQGPKAAFTESCDGLTCDFDASGSSDPEGPLASYAWDFGDGASGQGKTVSHTFDSAGTYQVKLTVTDSDGATDSVTHAVSAGGSVDVDTVPASAETDPVAHSGDAADDPAIWVDSSDPADSLVIGNDKAGALETYDLTGQRVQRITTPTGRWGNVDVRQQVNFGSETYDVVGAMFMGEGMRFYKVDPGTRQLSSVVAGDGTLSAGGEGFCLYHSKADGSLYAFTVRATGEVTQYRITDDNGDGMLEATQVRDFSVGSEAEGCVADDASGALYVAEEQVAIWRYGANPGDGTSRVAVDRVIADGGHIAPDIEGLTLAQTDTGGYLIASAQDVADRSSSYFTVYERGAGNNYVKSFRVVAGANADDCDGTDGIAAYAGNLGADYPHGLFVCQDNSNGLPGSQGNQDFKYADLGAAVPLGPVNASPVARFNAGCTGDTCEFDASASGDTDGNITSYDWQWGDGTTGQGASPEHIYSSDGTYQVTLVVTDNDGATGSITHSVTTTDTGQEHDVQFVASAHHTANRDFARVEVPAKVQSGDLMLLMLSTRTSANLSNPQGVTGWTRLDAHTNKGATSTVWWKHAGAGDAGQTVTINLGDRNKSDVVVAAYSGAGGSIAAYASAGEGRTVNHVSPTVDVSEGQFVVTWWTDKSSTTTTWTAPTSVTVRGVSIGSGGGHFSSLLADSGGPAAAGSYGGLTAKTNADSRGVNWTIALAPGNDQT